MTKPMKRRVVEAALAREGCYVVSDNGRHTKYGCACGKHTAALPHHKEISAGVVDSVGKQMGCLPKGWLQ
ncbi:type II toxin-antitoxin system HicA family toxin [Actinosynnema pretiosum]|uniref:type II toxin-antitoxin system HicA family toxin n=1 Tax=Actinosynnema pretiosum TaxID=42197 RepID=UPI0012FDA23C|nr:type II toxin-antitoxin system HicA family toxin [Actinosynnema pretiosum]